MMPILPPSRRVFLAALLGLPALACSPTSAETKISIPKLPANFVRGACLAHTWDKEGNTGYGTQASLKSKLALKKMGVNAVSLTPFASQRNLEDSALHFNPNRPGGESDEAITIEAQQCKELGVSVSLKPHIWTGHNTWRGHINPTKGWPEWFQSYKKFILHYARLAGKLGMEHYVVGVELKRASLEAPEQFRALIKAVRQVFSGRLTYAANWDEVKNVTFWDALDEVGVQFFPPLCSEKSAPYSVLENNAGKHLDAYLQVADRFKKPLILTEVGFTATSGAAQNPGAWPEKIKEIQVDPQTQADCYRAVLNAISHRPHVKGLYIWKWFTDLSTKEEGGAGFSPHNKLAETILAQAFLPS